MKLNEQEKSSIFYRFYFYFRLGEEVQTAKDRSSSIEKTKQKLEQTLDEVRKIGRRSRIRQQFWVNNSPRTVEYLKIRHDIEISLKRRIK
jgi:hypothetical protein